MDLDAQFVIADFVTVPGFGLVLVLYVFSFHISCLVVAFLNCGCVDSVPGLCFPGFFLMVVMCELRIHLKFLWIKLNLFLWISGN